MTTNELAEALRQGVTIAYDTNALWLTDGKLVELSKLVSQVNAKVAPGRKRGPNKLVVSALVHAERLLQLRHRISAQGGEFDEARITEGMKQKGLAVVDFTDLDSEHQARLLAEKYETREAWQEAKIDLSLGQLGLTDQKDRLGKDRHCSATTDWSISCQAEGRGWVLVCEDRGPDVELAGRRVTVAQLEITLEAVLGDSDG